MGISGLWKLLEPARSSTENFSSIAVREGLNRPSQGRVFRLGIDASIWIRELQHAHVSQHAQSGHSPELRTLFYRLVRLLNTCAQPVFVFDGAGRPRTKRRTHVRKQPHWMVKSFSELATAFGFLSHWAPGEAEAELARMNQLGLIDAVLTEDSDVFVFGAPTVIRSSTYKDNIKGCVSVYTADTIRTHAEVMLTHGGALLIALLCGGDYDEVGIPGCGIKTAHALARYGFGDALIDAYFALDGEVYDTYIHGWRDALRRTLIDDPKGLIGRTNQAIANKIDGSFPKPNIVHLYLQPLVSTDKTLCALRIVNPRRLLDLELLAELVFKHFDWCIEAHTKLRMLWGGVIHRELLQEVTSGGLHNLELTKSPLVGLLRYSIHGFDNKDRCKLTVRNGTFDNLIDNAQREMRGIVPDPYRVPVTHPSVPTSIFVYVPTSLFEQARPAEVAAFRSPESRIKGRSGLATTPAYAREIIDLTNDSDDE